MLWKPDGMTQNANCGLAMRKRYLSGMESELNSKKAEFGLSNLVLDGNGIQNLTSQSS